MVSVLVLYGTGEGQTAKVAETVAEALEERGYEVTVTDVAAESESGSVDVNEFDAVLVGASIHVGKQQAEIRTFVTERRDAFESRPTGFFQVSLSSATDDEVRRAEAAGYVDAFVEETGWQPDRVGLFGGALRYSKYGFLKRLVMKRIAREATGDTDTAQDYEYTDWEVVEAFANDFATFVEGRLGVAPPSSE